MITLSIVHVFSTLFLMLSLWLCILYLLWQASFNPTQWTINREARILHRIQTAYKIIYGTSMFEDKNWQKLAEEEIKRRMAIDDIFWELHMEIFFARDTAKTYTPKEWKHIKEAYHSSAEWRPLNLVDRLFWREEEGHTVFTRVFNKKRDDKIGI